MGGFDDSGVGAANQKLMQESLDYYNSMFGTNFTQEDGMRAYNKDINDRLARKKQKYLSRTNQLDLVIVVDRLLTGFDAPCMSTLFIDRPPLSPPNMIQAFSRTFVLSGGQTIKIVVVAILCKKVYNYITILCKKGKYGITILCNFSQRIVAILC